VGRRAEREALEQVLWQARAGHSGVLVLRGEPGIGKTALLEQAREAAESSGFRVESSVGVEAEAQFAFAGLHQLCSPLLGRLGELPEPQQAALSVAFGLRAGQAPDRFLVGLATLTLVAEIAEEAPLLCLVDDAQWLDEASAQVLAFVARRLSAERVALLFGVRDTGDAREGAGTDGANPFVGLPELPLSGLEEADALALLVAMVHTSLDDEVRARVVAEARGNPLALLELPSSAPARLAGGFELPDAQVRHRIEDEFRRRSAGLPTETQLLLLMAAADPSGDAALLWRAVAHLGIPPEAAAPAEHAGLLEIDTRVRFRHPLVRSAVYQAAAPSDKRRAHGALATATDPQSDPDRRAWHRAQAVRGPDEAVAADLERSADRARARGGLAAAAAFLLRAVDLTPDPSARAARALDAAHTAHMAGGGDTVQDLLAVAAAGPLNDLQSARLDLLRAQVAFDVSRDSDAPGLLLGAAARLAPLDAAMSRETYLQALDAAILTGGLGDGRDVNDVAEAAREAPPPPGPPRPVDLLLDGLVTTHTQGYEAGAPLMRKAVEAFRAYEPDAHPERSGSYHRWLPHASSTALALFDDESLHILADRTVRLARETGALATLNSALLLQAATLPLSGNLAYATELAAEQVVITRVIGAVPLRHAWLLLAAWSGDETETTQLHAASVQEGTGRADVSLVTVAEHALAVLHNGLGNYPAALAAAERAMASSRPYRSSLTTVLELVEAASRTDQPERAAAALEDFSARAIASGTPWALGLAAWSMALVSAGPEAEERYREAIEQLGNCRMVAHLARAHLVYGEWLRREGRRRDAREQLQTAHGLLSDMGAEAFAERAARELRATGEQARKRSPQPADALTAQEAHIARLVATGATSREVAAQLFLSPRTIEAHLRSIFRKLGITSRRQLKQLQLP
jgi:DNA-binding CsgD family transcriptional regulator